MKLSIRKDINIKLTAELDCEQIERIIRAAVREEMRKDMPPDAPADFYIDVNFEVRRDVVYGATVTAEANFEIAKVD